MNDGCKNCGTSQNDRPAIYRGEDYCSDKCRKALGLKKEVDERSG